MTAFCCPYADNSLSDPIQSAGSGEQPSDLKKLVAAGVAKTMPAVLRSLFNPPPALSETKTKDSEEAVKTSTESAPTSSRWGRFYSSEQATTISEDLLAFTTKAFSRALTKEKWKELTISYPQIKDTESFLVAPSMEAGMKEDIKKRHGYTKTKELFAFDDGLCGTPIGVPSGSSTPSSCLDSP